MRTGRHGRTGHDSSLLFAAGSAGFGNRHGRVWAAHLGFSGDHEAYLEKTPYGPAMLGMAELLGPGEITLAMGESYSTPWTYCAYSDSGMDGITQVFHRWLRARPVHPSSPRPVMLNTWEAVYFNHDLDTLTDHRAGAGGLEGDAEDRDIHDSARHRDAAAEGGDDLAAGLPPGVRIAHKNGWVTGIRHGAGVVFPDDAPPYAIAVCTTTDLPDAQACALVARVSATAWSARHRLAA